MIRYSDSAHQGCRKGMAEAEPASVPVSSRAANRELQESQVSCACAAGILRAGQKRLVKRAVIGGEGQNERRYAATCCIASHMAPHSQRAAKISARMSAAAVDFLLVRHGETAYNAEGRLQGATPPGPPLNDLGWRQARAVRRCQGEGGELRPCGRCAPSVRDALAPICLSQHTPTPNDTTTTTPICAARTRPGAARQPPRAL